MTTNVIKMHPGFYGLAVVWGKSPSMADPAGLFKYTVSVTIVRWIFYFNF
jgi:hypothetical protein